MQIEIKFHKHIPLDELALRYTKFKLWNDPPNQAEHEKRRGIEVRSLIQKEVPEKGGIYFLLDAGEVIYVGRSDNLRSRLFQHVRYSLKQADSIALQFVNGIPMQNVYESVAIAEFLPRLNIQGVSV